MAKFTSQREVVADIYAHYISKGIWQKSLIDHWERNAEVYPDKEALVDSRRRLTWAQAKQATDRLALGLRDLGIERDGTIATQLPWTVDYTLLRVAHEKAGLVCAEMTPNLRHREVAHILSTCDAQAIVSPWVFRGFDYVEMISEIRRDQPRLRHVIVAGPDVPSGTISLDGMLDRPIENEYARDFIARQRHSPFEMSCLWHTTGTTGLPKLVESAPAGVEWAGRKHKAETGDKLSSDDVCGVICPAIAGPNVLPFFGGSFVGARMVFLDHFRPADALKLFGQERVTVTGLVPAQLAMLLEVPDFDRYDLSSLRFIICTGASLNYEMSRQAEEMFGCPVVQHYGSQENGVVTVCQHPSEPQNQRLLTVGKPSVDCVVRIVDESGREVPRGEVGSIEARGGCMGSGYHKDVEGTYAVWTEDGFYRMGDLGKLDEHGNLALVGRAKDMIIRGGQNIYPVEIENLLLGHPKVFQVAIVGLPDLVMGERACAFVVPKTGESFDFEEMVDYLKAKRIAPYKLPERLELRDKLPLAGDQKVDKPALRREVTGGAAS